MYFIINNIIEEKNKMKMIAVDESGWICSYVDTNTGCEWVDYIIDDRSSSTMLMKKNLPKDLSSLMKLCLTSCDIVDGTGLGYYLSTEKYTYEEIYDYLKNNLELLNRDNIYSFGISFKPRDRRNILGMNYNKVCSTYEDYISTVNSIFRICGVNRKY